MFFFFFIFKIFKKDKCSFIYFYKECINLFCFFCYFLFCFYKYLKPFLKYIFKFFIKLKFYIWFFIFYFSTLWTNQSVSNMSFWLRIECSIMECCNFLFFLRVYFLWIIKLKWESHLFFTHTFLWFFFHKIKKKNSIYFYIFTNIIL